MYILNTCSDILFPVSEGYQGILKIKYSDLKVKNNSEKFQSMHKKVIKIEPHCHQGPKKTEESEPPVNTFQTNCYCLSSHSKVILSNILVIPRYTVEKNTVFYVQKRLFSTPNKDKIYRTVFKATINQKEVFTLKMNFCIFLVKSFQTLWE